MALTDEVSKLHKHYKICLAFVVFLMPFWYMSIFLFDRVLFNALSIHLAACICFCLSACWLAIFLLWFECWEYIRLLWKPFHTSSIKRNLIYYGFASVTILAAGILIHEVYYKVKGVVTFKLFILTVFKFAGESALYSMGTLILVFILWRLFWRKKHQSARRQITAKLKVLGAKLDTELIEVQQLDNIIKETRIKKLEFVKETLSSKTEEQIDKYIEELDGQFVDKRKILDELKKEIDALQAEYDK